MVLVAFHPGFEINVPQYTVTCYILITTETTEQRGNLLIFFFQYNVHARQDEKLIAVNSPISPDIVR